MGRDRTILQTLRNKKPAQAVLVQDERAVTRLTIEADLAIARLVIGWLVFFEISHVESDPVSFFGIPPDELLSLAPRCALRGGTGAVVENAAIAWPGEAPPVAQIVVRLAAQGLVHAIAIENAGVNPAAAGGRTIIFQFVVIGDLRAVMEFAFAILRKKGPVKCERSLGAPISVVRRALIGRPSPLLHGEGSPAVDLGQDGFHFRLTPFVLRVPPVECAQRLVHRIARLLRSLDQTERQLMEEPAFAPRLT